MSVKKYYAVRLGKVPGIYTTWAECQQNVNGFKGAVFKAFSALSDAEKFISGIENQFDEEDKNGRVEAYVDGSYFNGKYGWGLAVFKDGNLIFGDCGLGQSADNVQYHNIAGEVEAAKQAVFWAERNKIDKITIYHDYQGISEWAEGRWKANNRMTMEYAAFMRERRGCVIFRKVAGHTGVKGNELADKLAKKALNIL